MLKPFQVAFKYSLNETESQQSFLDQPERYRLQLAVAEKIPKTCSDTDTPYFVLSGSVALSQ